jgi:hypothetical protein
MDTLSSILLRVIVYKHADTHVIILLMAFSKMEIDCTDSPTFTDATDLEWFNDPCSF